MSPSEILRSATFRLACGYAGFFAGTTLLNRQELIRPIAPLDLPSTAITVPSAGRQNPAP